MTVHHQKQREQELWYGRNLEAEAMEEWLALHDLLKLLSYRT